MKPSTADVCNSNTTYWKIHSQKQILWSLFSHSKEQLYEQKLLQHTWHFKKAYGVKGYGVKGYGAIFWKRFNY